MIEKIPASEIASAVRAAAHDVFSTMLSLPLEDRPSYERIEADPPQNADGVEALVGIAGSWSGTGRICCSPQFACQVASAMLMTEYAGLNEEVLDAMAELANMIIGNVKTHFEESLGPLDLSIPMVIFGHNYRTRSIGAPSWVVVPFESGGCTWEIRFCLMPSRARSGAHQPAMLQAP
ncbi:MAG: chemotaxis protein CheX [Bryobacterales bacterium]|nr:chemotaxis protein CheX [Bryobacterales bacterium]